MSDIEIAARALMEAAGRARRDALVNLEAERIECRALIQKYDKARERLARLDAEYARVEAQKIEDIARQALGRAQKCDGDHIGPICADKQCWLRDPPEEDAEKPEPTLLDLRTVRLLEEHADPDWVVADADLFDVGEKEETHNPIVKKGQRFQVERVAAPYGAPRVKIHIDGNQVFIAAMQPARVVKEGGEQ